VIGPNLSDIVHDKIAIDTLNAEVNPTTQTMSTTAALQEGDKLSVAGIQNTTVSGTPTAIDIVKNDVSPKFEVTWLSPLS
jgi:hypothetical protein